MNATWRPDESEFWHPSGKRLNGESGISQNPPGNDLEGPYPAKGVDVASGAISPSIEGALVGAAELGPGNEWRKPREAGHGHRGLPAQPASARV